MTEDQRTYEGWIEVGRCVRKGQKAAFYLVNDEETESAGLFFESQTDPAHKRRDGWTKIVPAAERPGAPGQSKPKIKVEYKTATKTLYVWCGNNKKAIKALTTQGYRYNGKGYRWFAQRPGIAKTVEEFEKHGFEVQATEDGIPWPMPTI